MNEPDCIAFYRGLLKGCPHLLHLPERDQVARMGGAFKALFELAPTRDHIRIAVAKHSGNGVKRKWDLKQLYLISLFLADPELSTKAAHKTAQELFHQRTRMGVVDSCKEEAARRAKEYSPEEQAGFISHIRSQYSKKAKDLNVLSV